MSGNLSEAELQQRLQALIAQSRYLESLAGEFETRIAYVDAGVREYTTAELTLGGMKELSKNDGILVPVGGGSFLKASIADTEHIIISIGAGVAMEKTTEDAKLVVQTRINELKKLRANLQAELTKVVQNIEAIRSELVKISGSVRM